MTDGHRFSVTNTDEFVARLLSLARRVRLVGPESIRDHVRDLSLAAAGARVPSHGHGCLACGTPGNRSLDVVQAAAPDSRFVAGARQILSAYRSGRRTSRE